MYSYIKGQLIEKGKDRAIVETKSGVAYELLIIDSERSLFPGTGDLITLFAHLYVREDLQRLFGFIKRSNRNFFRQLLNLKGVGPSMALNILSDLGADRFRKAIHEEDLDTLQTISGVGKKTARRLVLELAEKLVTGPADADNSTNDKILNEAVEALLGLGFTKREASKMVSNVTNKIQYDSLEKLIGDSLSGMES